MERDTCRASVSTLLSLIHRLLAEHEVKLTFDLLESLASSVVSKSKLSISNKSLQKVLLTFVKGKRNRVDNNLGFRVIEDSCLDFVMESPFMPGAKVLPLSSSRATSPGACSQAANNSACSQTSAFFINEANGYHVMFGKHSPNTLEVGGHHVQKNQTQRSNRPADNRSRKRANSLALHSATKIEQACASVSKLSHRSANGAFLPTLLAAQRRSSSLSDLDQKQEYLPREESLRSSESCVNSEKHSLHLDDTSNAPSECSEEPVRASEEKVRIPDFVPPAARYHRQRRSLSMPNAVSFARMPVTLHPVIERSRASLSQSPEPPPISANCDIFSEPIPCNRSEHSHRSADRSHQSSSSSSSSECSESNASRKTSRPVDSTLAMTLHEDPVICQMCSRQFSGTCFYCSSKECYYCIACTEQMEKKVDQSEVFISNDTEACPDDSSSSAESEDDERLAEVAFHDELDDLSLQQTHWLATPSGPFILHPNSLNRVVWDLLALIFILMECVTLPLRFSFLVDFPDALNWGSTVFFSLDMVANFSTGYFYNSILIMRRRFIWRHYIRSWFVVDFAATFPWEETIVGFTNGDSNNGQAAILHAARLGKALRCLRLLRVMKVARLLRGFQDIDILNSYGVKIAISILKLLAFFGMLCHWVACIWGWLGDASTFVEDSTSEIPHNISTCVPGGPCENGIWGSPWRHRYGMDNFDLATQYLASLHFATGLVTANELPFQPAFWLERVFATVMMIVGLFICSAMLSQVLVMSNRLAEKSIARSEQLQSMRDFMMARKVGPELQAKIRVYLVSQAASKMGHSDYTILNVLSPTLRNELVEHMNYKVISKHAFFAKLPSAAMRRVCLQAEASVYAPSEIVVEKGHLAFSMHFIVSGKLRVEKAIENKKSVYLHTGAWLGEKCLFIETMRTHTVSAVCASEALCIQKRNIMTLCSEYQDVQLHFEAFQKRVCDGENISMCSICKKIGHSAQDCPDNLLAQMESSEKKAAFSLGNLGTQFQRRLSLSGNNLLSRTSASAALSSSTVVPMPSCLEDETVEVEALELPDDESIHDSVP